VGGFGGEKDDTFVFYAFTSYNYPTTQFRYDLATGKSTVFRSPEIKGFRPGDYDVRQAFFRSKDGTRVPIFVVAKKGLRRDGKNPTLLTGYGGFNSSETPAFSALRLGWLEQGGVYAVVNLRGGGSTARSGTRRGCASASRTSSTTASPPPSG
jgi:prolyl oligopeptidase